MGFHCTFLTMMEIGFQEGATKELLATNFSLSFFSLFSTLDIIKTARTETGIWCREGERWDLLPLVHGGHVSEKSLGVNTVQLTLYLGALFLSEYLLQLLALPLLVLFALVVVWVRVDQRLPVAVGRSVHVTIGHLKSFN